MITKVLFGRSYLFKALYFNCKKVLILLIFLRRTVSDIFLICMMTKDGYTLFERREMAIEIDVNTRAVHHD